MSDKLDLRSTQTRSVAFFKIRSEIKLWNKYNIGLPICELLFCSFEIETVIDVRLSEMRYRNSCFVILILNPTVGL